MIDDKKIEAAKEEIYEDRFLLNGEEIVFNNDEKEEMFYKEDIKEAIGLGAKWAINEILKDLWHSYNEVPTRKNSDILLFFEDYSADSEDDYDAYYDLAATREGFTQDEWESFMNIGGTPSNWLYINDLLPKEGGNHD